MRYVLTGDIFGAKEAFDMNLVSEIVPDADVEKRAVAMAAQIAELPPIAIQLAKESIIRGMDASLETGLTLETRTLQMLFASQDQKEGMAAFIEKRKPKFIGK
jgi:enoyl-CoA hydratase/carnithine racemase